ncbi:hypothetical protein [Nocardioides gilvus]|uniref:hypothetical protein n=1 Tax=Nocardioides gilvus TaxID=1735589 RepID=UPI001EF42B56|nr:hypothetical protein [Nocardioides gilvus]
MSTDDEQDPDQHDPDESTREHPHVGSLGEEALRLLGSFAGWAGQQGAEVHHGVEDVARQALDGVQAMTDGFEEHLATGAAECTWCPLCRTVHAVRELSPEVKAHLVSAASSLVKASAALLATVVPEQGASSQQSAPQPGPRSSPAQQSRIQHIDIDDPDPAT